jgi:hypothetical protein
MAIVAFELDAHDCGLDFFCDAPPEVFCATCGSCVDYSFLPRLRMGRRRFDFGYTYDGRLLVSDAAKKFLEANTVRGAGVQYAQVSARPSYWYPVPQKVLRFNPVPAETRFLDLCKKCGQYESVVGTVPFHIAANQRVADRGMYRTDLEFASDREKSFAYVVGPVLKDEIQRRFASAMFHPVYQ